MQGTEACGLQHTFSPRVKALERRANAAAALMHEPAGQATRAGARGQIGEQLGDSTGVPVVGANAQVDMARGPGGPEAAVNEVLSRLLPSQSLAVASARPRAIQQGVGANQRMMVSAQVPASIEYLLLTGGRTPSMVALCLQCTQLYTNANNHMIDTHVYFAFDRGALYKRWIMHLGIYQRNTADVSTH